MRLMMQRVHAEVDGVELSAPLTGTTAALGDVEVSVTPAADGLSAWSVANRSDRPVRIRSVSIGLDLEGISGALRMFRNGYQSWSRAAVGVFGEDTDPSCAPGSVEMMQGIHHADQRRAADGELRSEWVTVLADTSGSVLLAGFGAGSAHDGTWRLRNHPSGGVELRAEAFLGDLSIAAGESRPLLPFEVALGDDASVLLDGWASAVGRAGLARVGSPYQVGWCSWYHYFHGVTEADLRSNLALAQGWPFDVFQLDDGYQAAIGDWLDTNEKFPSSIDVLADAIAAEGRQPGIWMAPFICAPDSQVAAAHPGWLARFADDKPLWGMFNPEWGGGMDGVMYALDTTRPEVIEHLEQVGRSLVEAGFTYLKLDFTFAPAFDGVWADSSMTPAQRVRAGYDAVRRGAGDDAFILGCGVPLSHVVGVVDGNRIGPDVAPSWELAADQIHLPGYAEVAPATLHSWVNTLSRSFMHRRLWLNDPDCLMLRTDKTDMTADAVRTWAHAVAVSGGMALVSDDLALLGDDARALLAEVTEIGRVVDAASIEGGPPRCEDLMAAPLPSVLEGGGSRLEADLLAATSTLHRP